MVPLKVSPSLFTSGLLLTNTILAVSEPTQRKCLVLQPCSKPVESETAEPPADGAEGSEAGGSEAGGSEPEAAVEMSEADAKKKIAEDSKEFFAVRNLDEAEVYFRPFLLHIITCWSTPSS